MKSGRSLVDLATEIMRRASAKRDYVAPVGALSLHSNGTEQLQIAGVTDGNLAMTNLAHRQLGEYLKIPATYYDTLRAGRDKLPVEAYNRLDGSIAVSNLFDVTVNTLLRQAPSDRRMVRTLDGAARAFLSDRFRPLDHDEILAQLLPMLEDLPGIDYGASSMEVTDNRLYVKLVNARVRADVKVGDTVQAGVMLTNSEVGLGSFAVQPIIFRLICLNGMVVNKATRKYHTGGRLQLTDGTSGEEYLQTETMIARNKATILEMRDLTRGALSEALFNRQVEQLREAAGIKITGDPEKTIEVTQKQFGLSEAERAAVLRNLITGADLSLYGLANAVTAAAQTVESYDRSCELEAIGGRIVSASKEQIRELVAA